MRGSRQPFAALTHSHTHTLNPSLTHSHPHSHTPSLLYLLASLTCRRLVTDPHAWIKTAIRRTHSRGHVVQLSTRYCQLRRLTNFFTCHCPKLNLCNALRSGYVINGRFLHCVLVRVCVCVCVCVSEWWCGLERCLGHSTTVAASECCAPQ
jgi:hypothetical protein